MSSSSLHNWYGRTLRPPRPFIGRPKGPVLWHCRPPFAFSGVSVAAAKNGLLISNSCPPQTRGPPLSQACPALPGGSHGDVAKTLAVADDVIRAKRARIGNEREKVLGQWAQVLLIIGEASGVVTKMIGSGEQVCASAPTLLAVFEGKATATLQKRLCAINLFLTWCRSFGFQGFPLSEAVAFEYVKDLHAEAAPPTRAKSFREALNFAHGVLEVDLGGANMSRRVQGAALQSLSRKALLRQRAPLTVSMLSYLEQLTVVDVLERDSVMAGFFVLAALGRARAGDLARAAREPFLGL